MFFLRIILFEGVCFLFILIGDLNYTSVYTVASGLWINMVAVTSGSSGRVQNFKIISSFDTHLFLRILARI